MRRREGKRRGVRRETMSGGGGDEIGGRWGILWEKEGSTGRGCAVVSASHVHRAPLIRTASAVAFGCRVLWGGKKVCVVFLRCAGEADERLPLGKSVQLCAYLLFVGALAARLSDG